MRCDVIIPTYNNRAVITQTLQALYQQTLPAAFQPRLVMSDDGSQDDTLARAASVPMPSTWRLPLVISHPHAGPAQARNQALARLEAEIILFLGADIILRPKALAQHYHFHVNQPKSEAAALGMVRWDPRHKPTPLMEWMTHGGPQNNFDALLGKVAADPRHFLYAAHLSLKSAFLKSQRFSSAFTEYGWEDLELGGRLSEQGLALHLLPRAIGLHAHRYTAETIAQRQYAAGRGAVIYQDQHPAQKIIVSHSLLKSLRRRLFLAAGVANLLTLLVRILEYKYSTPRLYAAFTALHYWRGVYAAQATKK